MADIIKKIFRGSVRFCVENGTSSLLNKLRKFNISNVELKEDEILQFTVPLIHKNDVCRVLGKMTYKHKENRNIFSFFNFFYARAVLTVTALVCCAVFSVLDAFVFRISIEGVVGDERTAVSNFLRTNGVNRFMVKSRQLSSVVIDLVEELDFVAAANMRIEGSTLKVSVYRAENLSAEIAADADICAVCDGVVTRLIILSGTANAYIGKVVRAGDVLVAGPRASAIINIYNGSELVCVINETVLE